MSPNKKKHIPKKKPNGTEPKSQAVSEELKVARYQEKVKVPGTFEQLFKKAIGKK